MAVGYGRRFKNPQLTASDQLEQSRLHVTYTQNKFTNPITDLIARMYGSHEGLA